jgi:hypothetical protein
LTKTGIDYYSKIFTVLNETIRIMAEIDKVIDAHGGRPAHLRPRQRSRPQRQQAKISQVDRCGGVCTI